MRLLTAISRRAPELVAPVAGVMVASILVWQTSDAAFVASTDNLANNLGTGTVELVDNDSTAAMFDATDMVPGETYEECIEVDYTGTSFKVTPVTLYGSVPSQTNGFADHLDLVIEEGTGAAGFGDCTGFTSESSKYTGTVSNFAATHTDFATGIAGFTPVSGTTTKYYRFAMTLGTDTPNGSQGDSASVNFVWEIQSTA